MFDWSKYLQTTCLIETLGLHIEHHLVLSSCVTSAVVIKILVLNPLFKAHYSILLLVV